jgi:cation diffusion facilitator family transporter
MEADQRYRQTQRVTLVGALTNAVLASLQIVFGLVGKSQALLADGLHTLSDLSTDIIVLYASRRASKAADEDHPYGHGRIETLASMLLGGLLALVGIGIGWRGFEAVVDPQQTDPEAITIIFALLAIVAKESLYHYTIRAARAIHSSLLESNAWHHRSDAMSSIVVVVGISAQLAGIPYMDAAAAIIVAMMIFVMGLRLSRKALYELVDTALDATLVEKIQQTMTSSTSVEAVHSLRTRSMGGLGYVDAEILVNPRLTVSEAHFVAFQLEQLIKQEYSQIIDVQIHVDPLSESGHETVIELPPRARVEKDLALAWSKDGDSIEVSRFNLHYLHQGIELDLVLSNRFNQDEYAQQIEQLIQGAAGIEYIGKVNLYFAR